MSENKGTKVYCSHCDSFIPRRTAYNHSRLSTGSKIFGKPSQPEIDAKRKRRCYGSSDEEDANSFVEEDANNDADDGAERADSEQDSSGIEIHDEMENEEVDDRPQIWDDVTDTDINNDIINLPKNSNSLPCVDRAEKIILWILSSLLFIQCTHVFSDSCIGILLTLLKHVFNILSPHSNLCNAISEAFPGNLYSARKFIDFDRDNFTKFLVCPNCYALYKYDNVVVELNGDTVIRKCTNSVYGCQVANKENKTRKRGKFPCGSPLVRQVTLSSGKKVYYPLKVYCYKGVIDQLQQFLVRSDFISESGRWRHRDTQRDKIADVYDGKVWKDFVESGFFHSTYNFAGMLNVDWFQPYKRRRDISVGAIYMVLMNLPREKRYLRENVILVGILPALRKEPESLNSFLRPLVDELKALWRGLDMRVCDSDELVKTRFALLCAAADIPAARKLCGFLGHSATQGCSHCTKSFITSDGERSCAGFDTSNWIPRTKENHIKYTTRSENAPNATQKYKIEKEFGYRYSVLLQLDYFKPSRFLTIDPMHNLFLGTAKKMFSHWVDEEILQKKDLDQITSKIKSLNVASDVGRLPENISTNYGQFTSKEWKNWVLIYSMYVLQDILPESDLKIWQTVVLACKHICQPCISLQNIEIAHRLFVKFGTEVENAYGFSFVTPNIHMHCHLRESIKDFGSVYGFWLFSFERYNGVLSGLPSNKRSVEVQFMRKFQQFAFVYDLHNRDFGECNEFFEALVQNQEVNVVNCQNKVSILSASDESLENIAPNIWSNLSLCTFKQEAYVLCQLTGTEKAFLSEMYSYIYNRNINVSMLASFFRKFASLYIDNELFGSTKSSKVGNYSTVLAKWTDGDTKCASSELRPAKVKFYLLHTLENDSGIYIEHMIAYVDWFKSTTRRFDYKSPVSVWQTKCQNDGPASYLPVQRIDRKFSCKIEKHGGNESFLVICPNVRHDFR